MQPADLAQYSNGAPQILGMLGFMFPLFIALIAWSIVWKGLALWKSARQSDKVWFVVFLVVNTLGILEILYIYVFGKKSGQAGGPPASVGTSGEVKI